jgi:O-antigen/teichoic acid export membrane protein
MTKQSIWQKTLSSGFLHVFSANMISYLVAFCGSIAYARLLGVHDFGIYAFSYNIITFFLLVNGFGAASGVLQFVSRSSANPALQLSYLKYSFKLGLSFNVLLSIGIINAFTVSMPIPGSRNLLLLMAFFPIGRLYIDIFQAYLRATQDNKRLAKFAISSNLILLFSNILGIYVYGLHGFVISTYLSYGIVILLATYIYKLPNLVKIVQERLDTREFVGYSIYATIGNAFAQVLFILDIFLLGYIIKDGAVVAAYKVATVIPFALNFIPGIISTFFYPYFAKNVANLNYIRRLRRKVQYGMLAFALPTSLILILIARPLILFIFGAQYGQSVLPFQILVFGFWIVATFRTINGNILASLGKAKMAMWLNVVIVSINIILTYVLVKFYGIVGAAVGVVAIYILAGALATIALNQVLSKK